MFVVNDQGFRCIGGLGSVDVAPLLLCNNCFTSVCSVQPASDCENVEHGQEVALQLCEARHISHPAEKALNEISHHIDVRAVWNWDAGV
jgi:hypothetical protein